MDRSDGSSAVAATSARCSYRERTLKSCGDSGDLLVDFAVGRHHRFHPNANADVEVLRVAHAGVRNGVRSGDVVLFVNA